MSNKVGRNDNCLTWSDIAITNFLVSNSREVRFHDIRGQITVHMYSYAKISKHG